MVLEHGDLVGRDEDPGVLGALGPGEQDEPVEYAEHHEAGESQ